MSRSFLELRGESGRIPSGRQLPRTPPQTEVSRRLDFSMEDPEESWETAKVGLDSIILRFKLISVIIKARLGLQVGPRGPDEPELPRSLDLHMLELRPGPAPLRPLISLAARMSSPLTSVLRDVWTRPGEGHEGLPADPQ